MLHWKYGGNGDARPEFPELIAAKNLKNLRGKIKVGRFFNQHASRTAITLFAVEFFILIVSVYLGSAIRFFESSHPFSVSFTGKFPEAITFSLVSSLSMITLGMYHLDYREDFRYTLLRLIVSLILGFGLITLIYYLFPDIYLGRGVLGIVTLIAALGIFLTRFILYRRYSHNLLDARVMVLGTGRLAKECSDLVEKSTGPRKFQIVGFVSMPNEVCQVSSSPVLPLKGSLMSMANEHSIREIVVAVRNRRSEYFPIRELLECKLNGVQVCDMATFFERETSQIRVDYLQPSWLVFGGGFDQSFLRTNIKRDFDLLASTALLIVTLPVMLITALCIFIEDRRPILYRQERVGLDGHPFMVLKFRSMRNDAEKSGKPQWASENDPRTTRVGRIIRKLRIDELPQIINVFKGEMSFVGPRPERPYFVKQLCEEVPYYNMRHSIKPGITGWAQVRYQYGASVEDAIEKLQYDLYYVKNHSLFLDMIILIDTVQVVLFGKGSR